MPESKSLFFFFFKLILLLDMEDLKASWRTLRVPDAAGHSLSSSSCFLLVTRINHPSQVSNVFLPSYQWHVKSKAVRWPSYSGQTLLCLLLKSFLPGKQDLQTAELKGVGTGCGSFVCGCSSVAVSESNHTHSHTFISRPYIQALEESSLCIWLLKAYIVSCKIESQPFDMLSSAGTLSEWRWEPVA